MSYNIRVGRQEIPNFQNSYSNPCLDQCPKSSCCKDMFFFYLKPDELSKLVYKDTYTVKFDSIMQLPSKDELKFLRNGVYYSNRFDEGDFAAVVAGPCANLNNKSECSIYEQRPLPCRRFQAGSKNCDTARKRDNLPKLRIAY